MHFHAPKFVFDCTKDHVLLYQYKISILILFTKKRNVRTSETLSDKEKQEQSKEKMAKLPCFNLVIFFVIIYRFFLYFVVIDLLFVFLYFSGFLR
jgi:hypothetical protein